MTIAEAQQPEQAAPRPEKIFPVSWDQFHRDSRALAWRLSGAGPFEAIVCITRGGLVPAAIVARELGIKLIETVCVSSYTGTAQGELAVLKDVAPSIVARGGGGVRASSWSTIWSIPARPRKWCARWCRAPISPRSTPSRWAGRWSTPSSPKCRRTPGSIFPGIPVSPSSHRSTRPGCRAAAVFPGATAPAARLYDRASAKPCIATETEDPVDAITPKGKHDTLDTHSHVVGPAEMEWRQTRFPGCEVKGLLLDKATGLVTALMRLAPGADHARP